jgi:predicted nucleic acid-binding protein
MTNSVVCVDANIALKLVLPEHDSQLARTLWETWYARGTSILAPTLWGYEVTSTIRKWVHRGMLPADIEPDAFATVHQLAVHLMKPAGLHQRAWELARYFNFPVAYDAHYLALAEMADCPFWTADKRLFNTLSGALDWVHWLGNYQPES